MNDTGQADDPGADQHTMTTTEVAQLLQLGSPASARVQLRRWNIAAVGRDTASGEKRWPTGLVHEALRERAGRGARTDLRQQ